MSKHGGWPPTGFGERLKVERERAGLTQGDLAERVGCHPFTLSKLERGTQEPAWPLVLALAKALGVEVTAFVVEGGAEGTATKRPRGRPKK